MEKATRGPANRKIKASGDHKGRVAEVRKIE